MAARPPIQKEGSGKANEEYNIGEAPAVLIGVLSLPKLCFLHSHLPSFMQPDLLYG